MTKIASDFNVATASTLGITSITASKGQQVSLGKSNVSSMTKGAEVTNQLLTDVSKLIDCVKEQSKKFPKIAEIMAIEDSKVKF